MLANKRASGSVYAVSADRFRSRIALRTTVSTRAMDGAELSSKMTRPDCQ